MKIVVYNSHGQYAISRAEVEALYSVLPKQLWARIKEFHLAHSHPRQAETFEYDAALGIAYLICPVSQKNAEIRSQAISDLLVGLGRVRARSRFFFPLNERERSAYTELVEEWHSKCEAAMVRLHSSA